MMAVPLDDFIFFEQLYDQYSGAIYAVILREIGEHEAANDIFEDTFRYIFMHLHEYDSSMRLLFTWMSNIACYQVQQYKRIKEGLERQ